MRIKMTSLNELLLQGEEILKKNNIDDAKIDAWLLMEYVFGITKSWFLLNRDQKEEGPLVEKYLDLIYERSTHKPVQHIIGSQEFMGLEFFVNEDVLIPRQDTELLVEETIKIAKEKNHNNIKILDMCTGSGCIAISLSKFLENAQITGVDISTKALRIANKNAINNETECEFIQSDLFQNINEKFDIIVSNPPYIKREEINKLMLEVRDYEPINALDGGEDGLLFYRIISKDAINHLVNGGYLLFEIGFDEAETVMEILRSNGYKDIKLLKDLAGLDRVILAKYII